MFSVSEVEERRIAELAKTSGIGWPEEAHSSLALGSLVKEILAEDQEVRAAIKNALKLRASAHSTSVTSEPKAEVPTAAEVVGAYDSARKTYLARSQVLGTLTPGQMAALEERVSKAPTCPVTAPAEPAPVSAPSGKSEPVSEPSEPAKCVALGCENPAELGDTTCTNPFCALSLPPDSVAAPKRPNAAPASAPSTATDAAMADLGLAPTEVQANPFDSTLPSLADINAAMAWYRAHDHVALVEWMIGRLRAPRTPEIEARFAAWSAADRVHLLALAESKTVTFRNPPPEEEPEPLRENPFDALT